MANFDSFSSSPGTKSGSSAKKVIYTVILCTCVPSDRPDNDNEYIYIEQNKQSSDARSCLTMFPRHPLSIRQTMETRCFRATLYLYVRRRRPGVSVPPSIYTSDDGGPVFSRHPLSIRQMMEGRCFRATFYLYVRRRRAGVSAPPSIYTSDDGGPMASRVVARSVGDELVVVSHRG